MKFGLVQHREEELGDERVVRRDPNDIPLHDVQNVRERRRLHVEIVPLPPPALARLGTIDAPEGLLVGERIGRRLLYRGVVEWGVRRAVVGALLERVRGVPRSPFHDGTDTRRATWLEPRAKIELSYNEMLEGRLRDPVFRRLA